MRRIGIDFEYRPPVLGHGLEIVAMYAEDLDSGELWYLVEGQFGSNPPFPTDATVVIIAYTAEAELRCFHALSWPIPVNVICYHGEHRRVTNHIEMA